LFIFAHCSFLRYQTIIAEKNTSTRFKNEMNDIKQNKKHEPLTWEYIIGFTLTIIGVMFAFSIIVMTITGTNNLKVWLVDGDVFYRGPVVSEGAVLYQGTPDYLAFGITEIYRDEKAIYSLRQSDVSRYVIIVEDKSQYSLAEALELKLVTPEQLIVFVPTIKMTQIAKATD